MTDSKHKKSARDSSPSQSSVPDLVYSREKTEILEALESSLEGLDSEEARRKLRSYGPNRLREVGGRSVWRILWEQVRSLIMFLLVAAVAISLLTGQNIEAVAIVVVIVLNVAIGFFTEWRAVRAIEGLQEIGGMEATVRRQGETSRIRAEEVVPGDIVVLRPGDLVTADLRLLEIDTLQIDESPLTGESVPVSKKIDPVPEETPLAERTNMAYKGTTVVQGTGVGVAVTTGMDTELGEISALVEGTQEQVSHLETRLDRLGRKLVFLTLAVAALVSLSGALAGREVLLMLRTGVALAVAAAPEGLPIVATIALARSMRRMLKRNALMRRLSAVETLGATTVICTDKTGTLTEGSMSVRRLSLHELEIDTSDSEEGETRRGSSREGKDFDSSPFSLSVRVAVLSSDHKTAKDPMELALLEWGRQENFSVEELRESHPLVHEEPFNRDTKMMATVNGIDSGEDCLVAVKGAPEAVLDASTRFLSDDGEKELDDATRSSLAEKDDELAEEGLRVLALASKRTDWDEEESEPQEKLYRDLCFIGYVAFLDPPREEVRTALTQCRNAGIQVVMVTGDHPATAGHVARQVGLLDAEVEDGVILGSDFKDPETASEEENQRLRKARAFARTSPAQKLDLIELHQAHGAVVAMTGDGVNDAPALRKADIGIAMGKRGTEVARQAADMILKDDRFMSIVAAVEQGRIIFENIRRFVIYLLSGNVGEILAVGAAAVAGYPLPLLPLQILYLNTLNDVFPALALGVGPGIGREMERPPRDPAEEILTRTGWVKTGLFGLLIGVSVLMAFLGALEFGGLSEKEAVTVSFLSLSIGRLLHAFNMRHPKSGLLRNTVVLNPFLWGAFGICLLFLLLAIYLPSLAQILELTPPGRTGWGIVTVFSCLPLVIGQIYLLALKWHGRPRP